MMVSFCPKPRKSRALPASKVKAIEPEPDAVLSTTVAESAPARTASIPLGGVNPLGQLVEITLVLAVWWSVRSTSVKVSVPEVWTAWMVVCGPEASAASTGASLLPVMVIVTGWVKLTPLPSVTVTLYLMVRVSPAARKSKVWSGALNVAAIVPLIALSMLTEVVSADASAALSPSGSGATPDPDQVIDSRLALAVLKLKWVKVNSPAGVTSNAPLPVVWRSSTIACVPETSAVSTGLISTGSGLTVGTSMTPRLVAVVMVTANDAGAWF